MPLSLNEALLAAGGGGYGLTRDGRLYGLQGLYGGGGMGGSKGRAQAAAGAQKAEDDAIAKINETEGQIRREIDNIRSVVSRVNDQIMSAEMQNDPYSGGYEAMGATNALKAVAQRAAALVDQAEGVLATVTNEAATARSSGGWWALPFVGRYQAALSQVQSISRSSGQVENDLRMAMMRVEQARQKALAAKRQEEARIAAEEQRARDLAAAQQRAEAQAAADRQAVLDRQAALEQQQRADAQARMDAERARADAIAQAERDARMQEAQLKAQLISSQGERSSAMQQNMLQLELKRMEQEEARLAAQDARAAEREQAELQMRMMSMLPPQLMAQMLMAQAGVPAGGGGAPPGYQVIDDGMGPGSGAPRGPAMGPTMPGNQTYLFSQAPPPVQQQQGGGGLEFGTFSPGGEMFGMGAMGPAMRVNPALPEGARIEDGYRIEGPTNTGFKITSPDGRVFGMSNEQAFRPGVRVADPSTGAVIYSGPPEAGTSAAEVGGVFNMVIDLVGSAAGKAADAYGRVTGKVPAAPQAQQPAPKGSGSSLASYALGGALVVGGVIATAKLLSKKSAPTPALRLQNPFKFVKPRKRRRSRRRARSRAR